MTAANWYERCVAWPAPHMTFNMNVTTSAPVIYRRAAVMDLPALLRPRRVVSLLKLGIDNEMSPSVPPSA